MSAVNLKDTCCFLKTNGCIICFINAFEDTFVKIKSMKKFALITAVLVTAISLQSCRQADDVLSPEEIATLQKVQDSSNNSSNKDDDNTVGIDQSVPTATFVDGEIVPPPRK